MGSKRGNAYPLLERLLLPYLQRQQTQVAVALAKDGMETAQIYGIAQA